jgi:hypothetical protein
VNCDDQAFEWRQARLRDCGGPIDDPPVNPCIVGIDMIGADKMEKSEACRELLEQGGKIAIADGIYREALCPGGCRRCLANHMDR